MKLAQHTQLFQEIGLTTREAQTYLALIELGSSTVGSISKVTRIKRPTLYLILDELRKKGLVVKIPNPKKQIFSAQDPQVFIEEIAQRILSFQRILPELRAMRPKEESRTLYFENLAGMREALNYNLDSLRGSELVGFFATQRDASEEQLVLLRSWAKKAVKANISFRGIVPKDKSMETWRSNDKSEKREMKEIDFQEYPSTVSIDVSETFVRIMSFKHERVTIIEDRDAAKSLKAVFEMLWKRI